MPDGMLSGTPDATPRRERWLVISFMSGVEGHAASLHIDDRLRALMGMGVEPIVISSWCTPSSAAYRKIRTPCLSPSGLRFEARCLMRRMIPDDRRRRLLQSPLIIPLLPGHLLESALLIRDASWSWYVTAARAALRCARNNDVNLIYSASGMPCAHIAADICARATGLPWVAELQDPIVLPDGQKDGDRRFNLAVEQRVAAGSDAVVFVTHGARDRMEDRVPLGSRAHVIYPGADPSLFRGPAERRTPDGRLVLGHFGSLCMGRSLIPAANALEELMRRRPEARGKVRIVQMGRVDAEERRKLASLRDPGLVEIRPSAPRSITTGAMRACDVLLVVQHDGAISAETIPSKTYEYLLSGIPVLGLTCGNPHLVSLLREHGHFAEDIRDEGAVRRAVDTIYRSWVANGRVCAAIRPGALTTQRAAEELLEVVRRAMAAEGSGLRIA